MTDRTDKEEDRIAGLSDAELLAEWRSCQAETELCELLAGEAERRNLDL